MDAPRVFVSYTGRDLAAHAAVVRDQIQRLQWIAVDHKQWGASGRPSVPECLERVRGCDVLVVLVAHRYGWVPSSEERGDGERSITWLEVEEAKQHELVVLPFAVEPDAPWSPTLIEMLSDVVAGERLQRLKRHLGGTVCDFFSTPESLAQPVFQALTEARERVARKREEEAAEARERAERAQSATPGGAPPEGSPPPGAATLDGTVASDEASVIGYCRRLERRYRHMEILGFGERVNVSMPIDEVYVPLRATLARSVVGRPDCGRYDCDALADGADKFVRDLDLAEAFPVADRLGEGRGLAVVGDPGSGKTTAARYVAWRCADALHGPESLGLPPKTIPVMLPLRRLKPAHLEAGLESFLEEELSPVELSDVPDLGGALFRRGRLLWILDGLDEVADETMRAGVSRWVERALQQRADDYFLVTSRYAGYHGGAVLGAAFVELHVQPLDAAQVDDFVGRWYGVVEKSVHEHRAEAERAARQQSTRLLDVLSGKDFRNQRLASMVANPLLLSILCLVHREHLELPRRRSKLYDRCTDVLLKHWRDGKRLEGLDTEASRAVLAPLAWWMHQEKDRTEATMEDLVREAAEPLAEVAAQAGLSTDPERFLAQVCDECGLLVRPRPGYLAFLHLSFQEYLAAAHAAAEPARAKLLARQFGESWWREVILLSLGQGGARSSHELFGAALDAGHLDAGSALASHCFEDALHLPVTRFADALRDPGTPAARKATLLRLLQGRKDETLQAAARELAAGAAEPSETERTVASQADELLLRACESEGLAPAGHAGAKKAGAPYPQIGEPSAGTERLHERTGVVFVYIPAGEFRMGDDRSGDDDEKPAHLVRLAGFWMGKYPVTNAEYARFLEETPEQHPPKYWTSSRFKGQDQPVVGVSWYDAVDYCRWAGTLLPTETQWEYACRAGTTTDFWSGDTEYALADVGWYRGNSGPRTHPVGEKPANPWGLHDIHGNVWEWCADEWDAAAYSKPAASVPVQAPPPLPGGRPGADRVIRGGCWAGAARKARSAVRYVFHPSHSWDAAGFRLVLPAAAL